MEFKKNTIQDLRSFSSLDNIICIEHKTWPLVVMHLGQNYGTHYHNALGGDIDDSFDCWAALIYLLADCNSHMSCAYHSRSHCFTKRQGARVKGSMATVAWPTSCEL